MNVEQQLLNYRMVFFLSGPYIHNNCDIHV